MKYSFLKPQDHPHQTIAEEIVNAITHGMGTLLGVAALVIMLVMSAHHSGPTVIVGCAVFGSALILTYLSSTLYHALTYQPAKYLFKIFDHCTIYLLIAGTYTPVVLVLLDNAWAWTLFGLVWGIAAVGFVFKLLFIERYQFLSTIIYLGMGWIGMIAADKIYHALSFSGFMWLMSGGLFYTFGVIFFVLDGRVRYAHSVWHVFTILGSICHFFMIIFYVIPFKPILLA
jgi:hemolysin III